MPRNDVVIPHDSDDGFDTENRLCGTWLFDEYPTYEEWSAQFDFTAPPDMGKLEPAHFGHLPVWSMGNVYLAGAGACRHEENGLVLDKDVRVNLAEDEGRWYLDTNLYDLLQDFRVPLVHTDTLGKAFEPSQKFENPDGTPIVFDQDYFGQKRSFSTLPGPFADAQTAKQQL